ncbi:Hypothetical predicted protein, partial [Marmota monax]
VLLNTLTGEIECKFHAYVQPQEHPVLSEFCMELTGIKQAQVDEEAPLKICLSQFCKWIHKIQQQKKIIFATGVSEPSTSAAKLCAFVTWSDWDLGVCLEYECKRKQLLKPMFLNSWIDLRATYKLFCRRKPKGLSGALQEVSLKGIHLVPQFSHQQKKQTFTIHEEKPASSDCSPRKSSCQKVAPPLVLTSAVNLQEPWKSGKMTPPLCKCGRRSKRLVVSNNGPNHGRVFYCCPI